MSVNNVLGRLGLEKVMGRDAGKYRDRRRMDVRTNGDGFGVKGKKGCGRRGGLSCPTLDFIKDLLTIIGGFNSPYSLYDDCMAQ